MFHSLTERQKAAAFYLLTLAMAVVVALFGPADAGQIQILSMLTPTVGVLLMLLVITPDGYRRKGWTQLALRRVGWRYWPLALLAPAAILGASYGAATLSGVVSMRLAPGALIKDLVAGIVIGSALAFFEEIGWRGYLLPKLATGLRRGAPALVGFLHGVWHLPLMLLTTAYNPAGNRFVIVPIFLAVLTGGGVVYGYLRAASGSIWPVVVLHGTFNAVLGTLAASAVIDHPVTAAYLTAETGVFTLAATVIAAAILTARRPAPHRANQPHPRPAPDEDRPHPSSAQSPAAEGQHP
jgi:membrane protease YdiL (CAAX protease family)